MKNLIYQYWDGELHCGVKAGSEAMRSYAERIGAEYLFEHNPRFVTNLGRYSPHYGSFKPIYTESFYQYDNVLFTDTDVFPVDELSESIFNGFDAEMGICTEPFQPKHRASVSGPICRAMDERWATAIKKQWNVDMPRTTDGLLKVYNSGVVLYSNRGLRAARDRFVPFLDYVRCVNSNKLSTFYTADQNYVHAMLEVAKMEYVELDNDWNSYVHFVGDRSMKTRPINDMRTKNTKFVHIQISSADHFDTDTLWRITNLPVNKWDLPI
ncbi:hypothetical protein [Neptunomonas sp.]|uniref:hypothetical protein n=1 Tax=Neptunomonas sp. TaxID=1971898 RepID=UPI003563B749